MVPQWLKPLTLLLFATLITIRAQTIILTNDDGWAVAQIRAQYSALKAGGFDVSISLLLLCQQTYAPTSIGRTFCTCRRPVGDGVLVKGPRFHVVDAVNGIPPFSDPVGL